MHVQPLDASRLGARDIRDLFWHHQVFGIISREQKQTADYSVGFAVVNTNNSSEMGQPTATAIFRLPWFSLQPNNCLLLHTTTKNGLVHKTTQSLLPCRTRGSERQVIRSSLPGHSKAVDPPSPPSNTLLGGGPRQRYSMDRPDQFPPIP